MKCDQCGKDKILLTSRRGKSVCYDCYNRPESVTANFETDTPIRFDYIDVAEISDPSFWAPSNDLGSWNDSGTNVRPQLLNMSGFPNQDDSIYGFTRDQLDSMQAERDELRASNEAQRQQIADKDAIIEQLRERLDRAKRGI